METYYTIDVSHNGHWHQWEYVTTREEADRLFDKYIEDDAFDDVSITLHTCNSWLHLKTKNEEEELPW